MDAILGDKFLGWIENHLESFGFISGINNHGRRQWQRKTQIMSVSWKRNIFTLKRFRWPWLRRKGQYIFTSIHAQKIVEKIKEWIEEENSEDFVRHNQQYLHEKKRMLVDSFYRIRCLIKDIQSLTKQE